MEAVMALNFTLDFWIEEGWYVGKLREVPGVFSQGKNLEELKTNIKDAYDLVMQETVPTPVKEFETTELSLEIP